MNKINNSLLKRRLNYSILHKTYHKSVISEKIGDKALVTLNRPNISNALNPTLNKEFYETLKHLENQTSSVLIKGNGNCFSTGGNLLEYFSVIPQKNFLYMYEFNLYLNAALHLLHSYKIPTICFLDGLVLGGATGIPVFSKYTVATEKSQFRLPEVTLGLFPNGGCSYYLHRLIGKVGYFMALSAYTVKGSDLLHLGLATHYCNSNKLPLIQKQLLGNSHDIKGVLDQNCEKTVPDLSLNPVLDKINYCFSALSVEEILSRLHQDDSDWSRKVLFFMKKSSPTSLKVALKQLQVSSNMGLEECLNLEDNLTVYPDYCRDGYEGIRTKFIDKDDVPKWNPSRIEDVTDDIVQKNFNENMFDIKDIIKGLFNERTIYK